MAENGETRTIKTDALARVEGEGAMQVRIRDGEVENVELQIYEPPRFFEAFLRGRAFSEAPDITARICGICPVAYMTSAFNAMEDALGVEVGERIRALRRLMYCGEWIESHALHVFLLHAPDFLGFDSAWAMARDHREVVEGGLRMKAVGNELLRTVGGRAIHPINVRVGGFYKAPWKRDLEALGPGTRGGAGLHARRSRLVLAGLDFPDFEQDYEFVALRDPDGYAIEDGRLVSSSGLDIGPGEYEEHFSEQHVPHSTALQSRMSDGGTYFLGPDGALLAQLRPALGGRARGGARGGARRGVPQPVQSILVRAVEILYALRRGAAADRRLRAARPAGVEIEPKASTGMRLERGAARDALAPLPARGRRLDRRGPDRSADLAEPGADRAGPAASSSARGSSSRTIACSGSASRRSATTTPASAARPTS